MIRMRMSDGKERKRNIDPHNPLLAAHLLILSECGRPGLFHPPRSSSAPLPLYICPLLLLESMRRDVRILLVGDGTIFFSPSWFAKLKHFRRGCW